MKASILLDVTRSVTRRFRGATPTGIDRVCDAYATRFGAEALAVIQLRGRAIVFDQEASQTLFRALNAPTTSFRRTLIALIAKRMWASPGANDIAGAIYLNVAHSDFDLGAHWRWISKSGVRPVYLLHDLIPLTHPHITTSPRVARHRGRVSRAMRHAYGVVATTNGTAGQLREFAKAQSSATPPILVAPIAGRLPTTTVQITNQTHSYFVSVGTIEKRKNHAILLRAWSLLIERLGDAAPQLVLAGGMGLGAHAVRAELNKHPHLKRHITIRNGLGDGELAQLVTGARAVLLPTVAEGFGLPLVEALQLGVPAIASDLASFREIGHGIPRLLAPDDAESWADAVADYCGDSADRQRQIQAAQIFRAPNWSDHFAALDDWLANLPKLGQNPEVDDGRVTYWPGDIGTSDREMQC